jgi:hypothetical protein
MMDAIRKGEKPGGRYTHVASFSPKFIKVTPTIRNDSTAYNVLSLILEHMNSDIKVKMWQSQCCTHYSTMKCGDKCTISSILIE